MTTRIISLHDIDDDDPLPPPSPLPIHGSDSVGTTPQRGGVLVFDNGTVVVVTQTTVVGRDPASDPRVAAGHLHGAVLTGADMVVSRAHAEVQVASDGVAVVDRRSTNGTHWRRMGTEQWQQLEPDVPTALRHGDGLSFGGLTCRFEPLGDAGSA